MKTYCPQCETVLNVTPSQLKARDGRVRCGVCHTVFNAFDYAFDTPITSPKASPHHDVIYDDRVYQDEPYIEDSRDHDDRVLYDDFDDDYYADSASRRRGGGVFLVFIVFILFVVLVLQSAMVFRNQLAHYFPSTRTLLMQLCSVANCELGGTRSISQFSLQKVTLNVRNDVPKSDKQTALILRATLVNKEALPGEWPSLVLSLKDKNGQVDRRRIISPKEYIASELRVRPMSAHSEYPILLHLTLNGAMASAYELKPYYED